MVSRRLMLISLLLSGLAATVLAAAPPSSAEVEFFEKQVRPILAEHCLSCHGAKKQKGDLRLDSRTAMLKGNDDGPVLVDGDPDRSKLILATRYDGEIKMPPKEKLPAKSIEALTKWVQMGAPWPESKAGSDQELKKKHWAFQPIRSSAIPQVKDKDWPATPVDHFILAKLETKGLTPAKPADRQTLIRRVTYDLIGLPPNPEEIEAFLKDASPDAFAKVVDRLLASPHYGERWGRHWLDVVRYADTGGFESDFLYPNAWRYRDYVIRSFNADKPFDRFLQEQVAGDELWPDDAEAMQATALYCIGAALEESAMVSDQLEYEWLTDAADTTGAAFLGLTFGCARCHDHKYDPITQTDYFALQSIFAASDRPYPAKVRTLRLKVINGLLAETPLPKELENDSRCSVQTEDQIGGFHLSHRPQPFAVRRLLRGELSKPREDVAPAFPSILPVEGHELSFSGVLPAKRRAAFSRWLTSPNNPLTARVLVNRVWRWHFGQAIVRTPNDFGTQGEPPTHPELLDWLARDFMDHCWSLKRLHRLILLSKTYQMQSVAGTLGAQADPENRLLGRFPRRRLEGETVRDAMLSCAGTLTFKQFGPAVVPPLSSNELTGLFDAKTKWPVTKDASEHSRRSIYLLVRRTFIYPAFAAFDPPEIMASCPQRMQTVVPTQALTLLNSPLAREQSDAFAKRLLKECGDDTDKLASRAWVLAFGRPASPKESEHARTFLEKRTASLLGNGITGPTPREAVLAELCLALFNANEFVYVD